MAALVEQSMEAGALGYSISRSLFHRVPDGRNVPGTWSRPEEFFAVAEPLARLGRGVLESAPRYNLENQPGDRVDEELAWMAEISRALGRPFSFNLQQISSLGEHYRRVLELAEEANRTGARLRPQITPRSVGVLFSLAANSLLDDLPSFQPYRSAPLADSSPPSATPRCADAWWRRAPTSRRSPSPGCSPCPPTNRPATTTTSRTRWPPSPAGPGPARSRPTSTQLDASDGRSLVNWPVMNQDEAAIEELVTSPVTIMGLADAGAHATQIMDASQPTYLLAHWVRDRQVLSLEEGVRRLTSDTADFVGYRDRGVVREGAHADLNVIDLDGLSLPVPEIVHDFPGGVPRFIQRADGIDHTIINGVPFMEAGEHTGALAGRLLRGTD